MGSPRQFIFSSGPPDYMTAVTLASLKQGKKLWRWLENEARGVCVGVKLDQEKGSLS